MTQNDRPPPKDAPSGLIGKLAVAVALAGTQRALDLEDHVGARVG